MASIDDVTDIAPRVQYVASAAQTVFAYPFPIMDDADLVVDVDGVTKALSTDYTVSGEGDETGGSVTFLSAMSGNEVVTIHREMSIERTTDFQQNGPFASSSFNDQLDRLTLVEQDTRAQVLRCLRIPMNAEVSNAEIEFTPISSWYDKFVYIDADGKPEPATAVDAVALTQSLIGQTFYPQTTAESNAGVTPTNYSFPELNVRRYGAVGDGVADDSTKIQNALNVAAAGGGGVVYLPEGIYLLESFQTGYYLLRAKTGVSVIGDGQKSVLKVANGLRSSTQGIAVLYDHDNPLADITYSDFTIDWNGANNLQPNPPTTSSNVNRTGGGNGCKNIKYRNVYLKEAAGNHHIFLSGGAGSNPNGNCSVAECTFQNAGNAVAGNVFAGDHTSVYMDAPNSVIADNVAFMDNLDDTVATAFETHHPSISITGNVVYGYNHFVNLGAQLRNTSNLVVSNNIARSCVRGIILYSSSAFVLSEVLVTNNVLGLRELSTNSCGILGNSTTLASSANGKNLTVKGNTIILESQSSLADIKRGMLLYRWNGVTIEDNTFLNWVGEAILLQAESAARNMSQIALNHNRFSGCGVNSSGTKRVIALNAGTTPGTDDITDVDILGNQIICDAPAGTVANFGIEFNNGRFPRVQIGENSIVGAATSPITKGATTAADQFIVRGMGAYDPVGLIRASLGSVWVDTGSANAPGRIYRGKLPTADGTSTVWLAEYSNNAAPTGGTWRVGDRVQQSVPAVASPKGWLCTAAGTPGTWVSEGNL